MKISVFGLGYVGSVLMGCLPELGHEVTGVDVKPEKVELIERGESPVYESELAKRIKKYYAEHKIHATTDTNTAIQNTDVCLICVGTPAKIDGSIDLDYIKNAIRTIGEGLAKRTGYYVVGTRSTVIPGTTEKIIIPMLEECSGKRLNKDFGVCMNPEFLREGQAVYDFFHPSRTIIGESAPKAGEMISRVYAGIDAPVARVPIKYAEMIKYADNSYHGLKIAFANEIGTICNSMGLDSNELMRLFILDTKLNISSHYLKPGFAFGGTCIPKDLSAIIHQSRTYDIELPLLEGILESNTKHIERALEVITNQNRTKIGILGLSFKENTDDIRESPVVKLVNLLFEKSYLRLHNKQYSIKIWDPHLNRKGLDEALPHFSPLLCESLKSVLNNSDVIVIGNANSELKALKDLQTKGKIIVDLVKLFDRDELPGTKYITIS